MTGETRVAVVPSRNGCRGSLPRGCGKSPFSASLRKAGVKLKGQRSVEGRCALKRAHSKRDGGDGELWWGCGVHASVEQPLTNWAAIAVPTVAQSANKYARAKHRVGHPCTIHANFAWRASLVGAVRTAVVMVGW